MPCRHNKSLLYRKRRGKLSYEIVILTSTLIFLQKRVGEEMKDPAFLFYSGDFLSGTMLMSNEEVGIYIKLLCIQHQQGHLEEADMLGFGATLKIFNKFQKDNDGKYFNKRLEAEISQRKAYSESRRNNRKKKEENNISETYEEDMKNICNSYVEHMENENINEIINRDNRKKDSKGKKEEEKIHFAEFVTMTNVEYEKLVNTHSKEFADQCITVLDNYKGSSGKTYKSDYRAILNWVVDEVKEKNNKTSKTTSQYPVKNLYKSNDSQYSNLNKFYL